MKRRQILGAFAAVIAAPAVASVPRRAAASNIPRVGILTVRNSSTIEVQQGLRELGYTEGETIAFGIVSTEGGSIASASSRLN
jgi:hypothetical protein